MLTSSCQSAPAAAPQKPIDWEMMYLPGEEPKACLKEEDVDAVVERMERCECR